MGRSSSLVGHLLDVQRVVGSSPARPTPIWARVSQISYASNARAFQVFDDVLRLLAVKPKRLAGSRSLCFELLISARCNLCNISSRMKYHLITQSFLHAQALSFLTLLLIMRFSFSFICRFAVYKLRRKIG